MSETSESGPELRFKVVVNHEDQYALWPDGRALPPGWSDAGRAGTKEECLAFVEEVWTDMTPRSLRGTTGETAPEDR